jgi:hypothetical protein
VWKFLPGLPLPFLFRVAEREKISINFLPVPHRKLSINFPGTTLWRAVYDSLFQIGLNIPLPITPKSRSGWAGYKFIAIAVFGQAEFPLGSNI